MKTKGIITLLLFLGSSVVFAMVFPEKGVPMLQNFTPAEYHNSGKVWGISSAPNGILYFASDGGLLEYDGKTWNHFRGSTGFTRSVLVVNDSLIYTGSDLDFGIWRRNKFKGFDYTSLYPFQEALKDISEEFWKIHLLHDGVLFVSSQNCYIYTNDQLVKIAAPSTFRGSFRSQETIYLVDEKSGLYVFEEFSLKLVTPLPEAINTQVAGITQMPGGLLIVTRDKGLFFYSANKITPWPIELSQQLSQAIVFSFEILGNTHLAFGTVLRGLFITDLEGNIIHRVNRQKGLPDNTILSLHSSPSGKLWLGMDYGVSSMDLKSNFTAFNDYRGDFGTGYTALLKNDIFYLGTNQGLYRSRWQDLNNNREFFRFELVPQTEGQVWTLINHNNTLLMGHDKGLFLVSDSNIEKISNQEGVWTIVPYKDYLLTGNYNGIYIFENIAGKWTFLKKMELILGSCNQLIVEHENVLWINIPNFGIIRAVLDENLFPAERTIFTLDQFEGRDLSIHLDNEGVQVFTHSSQYLYNPEKSEFAPLAERRSFPIAEGQLAGVYMPLAIHPDYYFFPVYNGFALKIRTNDVSSPGDFSLVLRKMEAFNNHQRVLIYPGVRLPRQLNNLHFRFAVPNQRDVRYQYRLNPGNPWSDWSEKNFIDVLNLKHGEYTMEVRAIIHNEIVEMNPVAFFIATPWFLTWYANIVYILVLSLIIYGLYNWQTIALKKQKKQMLLKEQNSLRQQRQKHRQELMRIEQQRLQKEYDQLKKQLKSKTIELAQKARDNEEKNRLLLALKEKCEKAQQNPALFDIKWGEMQRMLDSYLKIEDKTFEIQMDELHQEFFRELKERSPDLSSNDLRLCAYLKIGLNSKEIAEILNIQPSSFYISRSRLRKKLNLKPSEDLYSFLNSF